MNGATDRCDRERLLVVGSDAAAGAPWLARFASDHPDWEIARSPSALSAIADLSLRRADAVVALVDAPSDAWRDAVEGLREAAGPDSRLILCCPPESEPIARQALERGADDYLIHPPRTDELERAVGLIPRRGADADRFSRIATSSTPTASMIELAMLGDALAALDRRPTELLRRLAELTRTALRCNGATVVIEGTTASSGDVSGKPVLSVPLSAAVVPSATSLADSSPDRTSHLDNASDPTDDRPIELRGAVLVGERSGSPYTPADVEKLNHLAALFARIIAAARKQREWKSLAMTDECSGLPNRRFLRERLDAILHRASLEQFPVTVLLFDIDDFKTYNDRFGHAAGDEIIRMTGRLFRSHCREQDVVTRYGGDEFAVVFWEPSGPREPGSRHPRQALSVLDRFTASLRNHRFPSLGPSGVGRLTISGGLATFPWDGATVDSLIRKADEALLAAKRAGKNRIFLVGQASESDHDPT